MTALAGVWRFDGCPDAGEKCARMLAAQSVYGVDDERRWEGGHIALGRRLFHLLPEDDFDTGPLSDAAGRLTLVADLRLDNRGELIAALALDSNKARRLCDAALLLAAWQKWQVGCLDRLVGDFAFALWDEVESRLWLARDFLGQRPLHYHTADRFFAFASMPKGLHALAEIPYAPDEERVAEFLALLPDSGTRTFFQDVQRVEPGHVACVTSAGVEHRRYWNPERRTLRLRGSDAYVEAARHHLDHAVEARLRRSSGGVGAHLSAGLDSAAVAATAARLLRPSGGSVVAFTSVPRTGFDNAVPPGRFGDEGPLATETAALHHNMEHVKIASDGRSPLADLDRSFFLHETPVVNLCNGVWLNAINAAAKERGIAVMLTGQMGNMTISYHGIQLFSELIRHGRWWAWLEAGRAITRATGMRWRGVLRHSLGPWMPDPIWAGLQRLAGRDALALNDYSAISAGQIDAFDLGKRARARGLDFAYRPRADGFETRLWVLRRIDPGTINKGTLGGYGIDLRDPTADRRLVEFCLSVPTEEFLADGMPRALARRTLADRVPTEVLNERRRGLQAADWHEGLSAARDEVGWELDRLGESAPARTALDLGRLRALVSGWPSGEWNRPETIQAYRLALLRGISAGHFLRRATRSNM